MRRTDHPELRLQFDRIMDHLERISLESPCGPFSGESLQELLRTAQQCTATLRHAMDLAMALSDGRPSERHIQVHVQAAELLCQLGSALHQPERYDTALLHCERALQMSLDLGTPAPRLELAALVRRGVLLYLRGSAAAGIAHLEEVVAFMTPVVADLTYLRRTGSDADLAMLDLTQEDTKARALLDSARAHLATMRQGR